MEGGVNMLRPASTNDRSLFSSVHVHLLRNAELTEPLYAGLQHRDATASYMYILHANRYIWCFYTNVHHGG